MKDNSNILLRESIAQYLYDLGEYQDPVEIAMSINKGAGIVRSMLNEMTREGEVI